jgi:hypothetical protein
MEPLTHAQLFVEGPYKKLADARRSRDSLLGIETSVQGGLYVVSATLTSHLEAPAKEVARCLATVTGEGTIRF